MYIKELEKATNVSSKTIRLYEEKGLLESKREANGYRTYDTASIEVLKTIKLLRALQLPIPMIKEWIDGKDLYELLTDWLANIEKERIKTEITLQLLHEVITEVQTGTFKTDNHLAILDELKTDEFADMSQDLALLPHHSLAYYIMNSLMLGAPILWMFTMILTKSYDSLLLCAALSIPATVLLTFLWREYWIHRKEYRQMKKGGLTIFLTLIVVIICSIGIFALLSYLLELFFLKDGYLMWTMPHYNFLLPFFFMLEFLCFSFAFVAEKTKNIDILYLKDIKNFILKHKLVVAILNVVVLYLFFSSHAVVYSDRIEISKWLSPIEKAYTIEDIDQVRCGFLGNRLSVDGLHKGDFYYYIDMKDGTVVDISQPYPNKAERYEKHTYLEIEEYDAYLMKQNIPKQGSLDNVNSNTLGKEYKNRFIKIIENTQ